MPGSQALCVPLNVSELRAPAGYESRELMGGATAGSPHPPSCVGVLQGSPFVFRLLKTIARERSFAKTELFFSWRVSTTHTSNLKPFIPHPTIHKKPSSQAPYIPDRKWCTWSGHKNATAHTAHSTDTWVGSRI